MVALQWHLGMHGFPGQSSGLCVGTGVCISRALDPYAVSEPEIAIYESHAISTSPVWHRPRDRRLDPGRKLATEDFQPYDLRGRRVRTGAAVLLDADYEERAIYTVSGKNEVPGDAFGPADLT